MVPLLRRVVKLCRVYIIISKCVAVLSNNCNRVFTIGIF